MVATTAGMPPPLYLVAPVWGERYVRVFVDVALPTLLAPRNIPCLPNLPESALHIYTLPQWVDVIRTAPAFQALSEIMPVHIHLFEGVDENKYSQMSWGHLRGMELANEAEAATVFLNADMIFSNGTFESIARILAAGKRVIEIDGVRANEPGMVKALRGRYFNSTQNNITISPERLVRLMLDNLHRMTLTHFWEAEDEQGFMPFHTYFRAGHYGLISRSTHLHPLVLFPRQPVQIERITTIDWDLIDQACPDIDDVYVVTDSREILAVELSPPDYYVRPWYPSRDVELYREQFYHNTHCCSERHRNTLRNTICFYGGSRGYLGWLLARRKADWWYKQVTARAGTELPRPIEGRLKRSALAQFARFFAPCFPHGLPSIVQEVVGEQFVRRFHRSYHLYRESGAQLGASVPQALSRAPRFLWNSLDEPALQWLANLDEIYAQAFRASDVQPTTDMDIALGDVFFGTGWGNAGFLFGQTLRHLGPDDTAAVYVRLHPADYDLALYVYSAPKGEISTIRVLANGLDLDEAKVEWVVDRYRYSGRISRSAVVAGDGVVVLKIAAGSSERHSGGVSSDQDSGFSFTRMTVRQCGESLTTIEKPVGEGGAPAHRRRVRMLVALWGEAYIRLFGQSCLPTLLAAGNLPALAARHDVDLVFLTAEADSQHFANLPEYAVLRTIVNVELQSIDEILSEWWHPTSNAYGIVLTMAFHQGIMAMGDAQLDTHFIFWNADFCVADGAFAHLAEVLAYSDVGAILAPSLRVDEETIVPEMMRHRESGRPVIAIPPRDLSRIALDNLHRTVKAKTINRSSGYVTKLANQFYWWVDDELLVGRNFLFFMLCIRPERIRSEVATYCDYGFVPEMVPSGRVHTIVDSDDMLLLELQNPDKESEYFVKADLRMPVEPRDCCEYISEWSTAEQRANSRALTVVRAGNRQYDLSSVRAMTDQFMDELYLGLYPEPRWHNGHPYWAGTILAMGKPYRTTLPRSRHTDQFRRLGIDFDLYAQAELYFGDVWRDVLSTVESRDVSDDLLRQQLSILDERYPEVFRRANLPHTSEIDLDLTGDFFGTGWGLSESIDGVQARWINASGLSRIWLRLQTGHLMYRGWLSVRSSTDDRDTVEVRVNGNKYFQEITRDGDTSRIEFFLPGGIVDSSSGCIEIQVEAGTPVARDSRLVVVSVTRLAIEGIEVVSESWKVVLPLLDSGKLDVARQLLASFGQQAADSPVGTLLASRLAVLSEGRGWTRHDLDPMLAQQIREGDVEGIDAIVASIGRSEQGDDAVTRVLNRLALCYPADGRRWMSLCLAARHSHHSKIALAAIERTLTIAEGQYLQAYPDVAEAVFAGGVVDAADHYLRHGIHEGRWWPDFVPTSEVAAGVYLRRYWDVGEEIKAGLITWADDHYRQRGSAEGREWLDAASAGVVG